MSVRTIGSLLHCLEAEVAFPSRFKVRDIS